MTQPQ